MFSSVLYVFSMKSITACLAVFIFLPSIDDDTSSTSTMFVEAKLFLYFVTATVLSIGLITSFVGFPFTYAVFFILSPVIPAVTLIGITIVLVAVAGIWTLNVPLYSAWISTSVNGSPSKVISPFTSTFTLPWFNPGILSWTVTSVATSVLFVISIV